MGTVRREAVSGRVVSQNGWQAKQLRLRTGILSSLKAGIGVIRVKQGNHVAQSYAPPSQ